MFSIGDFVMIKGSGIRRKIVQMQNYGSGRCTRCMRYTAGIDLDAGKLYCECELIKVISQTLLLEIKDTALEYMCRPGGELYLVARDHFSGTLTRLSQIDH